MIYFLNLFIFLFPLVCWPAVLVKQTDFPGLKNLDFIEPLSTLEVYSDLKEDYLFFQTEFIEGDTYKFSLVHAKLGLESVRDQGYLNEFIILKLESHAIKVIVQSDKNSFNTDIIGTISGDVVTLLNREFKNLDYLDRVSKILNDDSIHFLNLDINQNYSQTVDKLFSKFQVKIQEREFNEAFDLFDPSYTETLNITDSVKEEIFLTFSKYKPSFYTISLNNENLLYAEFYKINDQSYTASFKEIDKTILKFSDPDKYYDLSLKYLDLFPLIFLLMES